jgi:hypothetical protein
MIQERQKHPADILGIVGSYYSQKCVSWFIAKMFMKYLSVDLKLRNMKDEV